MKTKDIEIGKEYAWQRYGQAWSALAHSHKVRIVGIGAERRTQNWTTAHDGIACFRIDEKGNHTTTDPIIVTARQIMRPWDEHELLLAEQKKRDDARKAQRKAEEALREKQAKEIKQLGKELKVPVGSLVGYRQQVTLSYDQIKALLLRLKKAENAD